MQELPIRFFCIVDGIPRVWGLRICWGNVAARPVQSVTVGGVPVDLDGVGGDFSDLVAVFVRVLFLPGAR